MYNRQNNILAEDILREYIRRSIIVEQRRILEENILRKALEWTKNKKESLKKSVPEFLKNLRDFFSKQKSGEKRLRYILEGK